MPNPSSGKIIRIYHECEGMIEKSVPRIAFLTSRGLPSDDKRFYSSTTLMILFVCFDPLIFSQPFFSQFGTGVFLG